MSKSWVWLGALAALGLACSASSKSSSNPLHVGDTTSVGGSDGSGASGGSTSTAVGAGGGLPSGVTCTLDGCSGMIQSAAGTSGTSGQGGTSSGTGGTQGQAGKAGSSTGTPGTVGSPCKSGVCDPGLMCSAQQFCQPVLSAPPAEVAQAVPPPDSPGVPPASPVILFMKGTFDGLLFDVKAYSSSGTVDYNPNLVTIRLTSAMKSDVYVLATKQPYPLGSSVVVTMSGPVTGKLVFNIASKNPPAPTGALGFEPATASTSPGSPFHQLQPGWVGFGDTGVVTNPIIGMGATGMMTEVPSEGAAWGGLSSGSLLGGAAVNGQSSILETGPMPGTFETLTFDYDFHSAELPTYCGSMYDDTLVAVVSGPNGAYANIVDSVNLVCADKGASGGVPGSLVPETLAGSTTDFAMYGTGRKSFSIPASVGSPAVFALAITNVADTAFPSLAAVDNIVLK